MKHTPGALIGSILSSLLVIAAQAAPVEQPGILPKDAICSSCHADKTEGKSVHSAMALPCTVCHLIETKGDMTTLNLFVPKGTICFACLKNLSHWRATLRVPKYSAWSAMILTAAVVLRYCEKRLMSSDRSVGVYLGTH